MSQHSELSLETLQLQYNGMQILYVEEYCFFFPSENKNLFKNLNRLNLC